MFSYYGSKSRIARFYPAPKHDILIEPFAGSARYALEHWEKQVWLYDVNPKIVAVWQYLIAATERDILGLPDMVVGQVIPVSLSDAERWLMGFCIGRGDHSPRQKAGPWLEETRTTHEYRNWWAINRQRISETIYRVKHWHIEQASYDSLPNGKATWFIDAPYQVGGSRYDYTGIDYEHLSAWCQERQGQVIVCEAEGAQWLPFKPFRTQSTGYGTTQHGEVVWTND